MKDDSDPLAAWFSDDPPPDDSEIRLDAHAPMSGAETSPLRHTGRTRRSVVIIAVIAALLWATVIAMGATAAGDHPPDEAPASDTASMPDTGTEPTSAPTEAPEPAGLGHLVHGRADVAARAGATAVVAVHDRVTGAGDTRWVDAAAVESVHMLDLSLPSEAGTEPRPPVPSPQPLPPGPGPDEQPFSAVYAVVLQAVVLEGDGDQWDRRRRARYAVPVGCDTSACRDLAAPWPLSPDPTRPTNLSPPPKADDPLVSALQRQGYTDVAIESQKLLWPQIAEVRLDAVPPDGRQAEGFVIWAHVATDEASTTDDGAPAPATARVVGAGLSPEAVASQPHPERK